MRAGSALKVALLLASIMVPSPAADAQSRARHPNKEAGKGKAEAPSAEASDLPLRARARALVASTADESLKWDDRGAAVRVLSQAADLLWDEQPDRARTWLTRAWDLASELASENTDSATRGFRNNSPQAGARATVLAVAGRRDRQLADRFIEQLTTDQEQSRFDSQRGIFDDRTARSEQLLNMALASVESDPALAASLGERSLIDGISFQFQSLLLNLQARDPAAANRLLDAALGRLATSFSNASEGEIIASYMFTPGRVFSAGHGNKAAMAVGSQTPLPPKTPAEADPVRTRRFLSIMQQIMLSLPAPSATADPAQSALEFSTLAGSLAGAFNRYAPELWTPIQQRLTQVVPDLAPASTEHKLPSVVNDKLQAGRAAGASEKELNRLYVDGLEEAADKETDPIARKLAYAQAALATDAEDLERGRRIAAKIEEDELRTQVSSFLVYRAALLLLEKGELDQAVSMASEAKPMQHALVLITAAQRMSAAPPEKNEVQATNRRLRALNLLYEAEKLLKQNDLPAEALRIRLGLVAALAPLDATHAFEVLSNVIAAINLTDGFDPTDASAPRLTGLDGLQRQIPAPRIRSGYGLKDALAPLARVDFEGSVMAVGKLQAPAVRGLCMLEIARGILDAKPGPQPVKGSAARGPKPATL